MAPLRRALGVLDCVSTAAQPLTSEVLSDRSFGVNLRFVDEDRDASLDSEDCFLSLEFNTLSN